MRKNVKVVEENEHGRNILFQKENGQKITDREFVLEINTGKWEGAYHTRNINGKLTPVSNPDGSEGNNLD